MNSIHPSADQLERYRRRAASPAEALDVDAHIATCDACFDAVRADVHLTYEELEALADGRGEEAPHLVLCAVCRRELADLREMREALAGGAVGLQPTGLSAGASRVPRWAEGPPLHWVLAAAAILVIVFLILRKEPAAVPSAPPIVQTVPVVEPVEAIALEKPRILDTLITTAGVLRGRAGPGAFALQAPVATVVLEQRPRFRWQPLRGVTSYEVAVVDLERGSVAASGSATRASWQPDTPLPRGRTYAWQVTARTGGGAIVAPGRAGPEARFHVDENGAVEGDTPRDRGIALARRGVLDDAERELELARAPELLTQIRAWRGQRPLPTTTNGAQ